MGVHKVLPTIRETEYEQFKTLIPAGLPATHAKWRVVHQEESNRRGGEVLEIEVSPAEFREHMRYRPGAVTKIYPK